MPISNNDNSLYIDSLFNRLEKHFDIERNVIQCNEAFDLYACHRRDYFKSFLTRSTVYEGFSIYEYILVKAIDSVNEKIITDFQQNLKALNSAIVHTNKFHKKTTIIGILVVKDKVPHQLAKYVKKFFYRKTYKFSFRGWSETQTAIVSLEDKNIYYPKHLENLKTLLNF